MGIRQEKDTNDSKCRENIINSQELKKHIDSGDLTIKSNTWMPFKKDYTDRGVQISKDDLYDGCSQIFDNITITPHGRISSCCGLTFEHIPEMKIGNIRDNSLYDAYQSQLEDFLKIWIRVDGPYKIIEKLVGRDYIYREIGTISHNCQACIYLHKDPKIVKTMLKKYINFVPEVLLKFNSMLAARSIMANKTIN